MKVIRLIVLMCLGGIVPTPAFGQTIVWTDADARRIQRKDVNGSEVGTIVQFPSPQGAYSIHYDPMTAKLYYFYFLGGQSVSFQRADFDGSDPENIPTPSVGPFTLNVDSRKLYWSTENGLNRSELDGSGVESHTYPVCCIFTLEAFGDEVFFGAGGAMGKGIWRADADGSNEQFLHSSGQPMDLAYDPVENKIYLAGISEIYRLNPDGTGFQSVVLLPAWQFDQGHPEQVVVDSRSRKLYWADPTAKVIQRSNLDGSNIETFVTASDVGNPNLDIRGLTIVYNSTPVPDPGGHKGRALSFHVGAPTATGPASMAIRVTMVTLQDPDPPNAPPYPPPDFGAYESGTCSAFGEANGCVRWVGKPGAFLESQDNPPQGSFTAARLQCTPDYHDFSSVGLLRVVGAEVLPSSDYDVQVFAANCMGSESTCIDVTPVVRMTTPRFGDVAAPFNPPSPATQPDAIDVTQLVTKFKNLPGAISKPAAQVQPNLPELNTDVNAIDLTVGVDAFKGFAYPFSGPCPCPSTVTCGAVPCPSGPATCVTNFGSGATCVKTCDTGDNAGEPCINNTHCPGGMCGDPLCRDRCGRCIPLQTG